MSTDQDGRPPQFGSRIPAHVEAAYIDFTNEIDYNNRTEHITNSHVHRQALYEFLLNHWEELPEESKENLEKDWLEQKTDGGLGVDL